MRTFAPQMPPQLSAVDQYPNSGMRMPQVDAIRRARMGAQAPLYSASDEVMGGTKPMAEPAMGGMKPAGENMGTKPMMEPQMAQKPGFNDPRLSQFGRKPARMGAPSGRGMPGIPGPAPSVREVM